jgi:hypothetical protein
MLNSNDVSALRTRSTNDAQLAADRTRLINSKDNYIAAPLASAGTGNKSGVDENEEITVTLALMYLLDPVAHANAGARVVTRVLDMCTHANTADWTPQSWLNMGSAAFAVAVGYDWCYNAFTDAQRTSVESGAKTRGIDQYNAHEVSQTSLEMWHGDNWAGQINGGIGCLIRALWNETTYQATLNTAWSNWEARIQRGTIWSDLNSVRWDRPLESSGGYREGGYIDYYIQKVIAALATYKAQVGSHHSFWSTWGPKARNAGKFVMHKAGPPASLTTDTAHNGEPLMLRFSDGSDRWMGDEDAAWVGYVANEYNDAFLRGVLQASRSWRQDDITPSHVLGVERFIWYRDAGQTVTAAGEPRDAYFADTALWTARSSWTDPNAIYVGGRVGGSCEEGHTHIDRGSPLLFGHGVDYLCDLGEDRREGAGGGVYDNFHSPSEENGDRWRFPRLRASGHSCVVINPNNQPDQRVGFDTRQWFGTVISHAEEVASPFIVMDLTELYSGRTPWTNVTSVKRGWKLDARNKLIIQDEVSAGSGAALDLWALYQTRKTGTTSRITFQSSNREAIMAAPGTDNRRCFCRILEPAAATFAKRNVTPLPGVTYLYSGTDINSNSGFETLYVNLNVNSSSTLRLSVMFMPLGDAESNPTSFPTVTALSSW